MTPEERAKLRELHVDARLGKWVFLRRKNRYDIVESSEGHYVASTDAESDARAIVATHNALPGLLDALDAAENEIARLKADKSEAYAMRMDAAEAEVARLQAGGCARDQRTTQHCAEDVGLAAEVKRLKEEVAAYECWMRDVIKTDACWPDGPDGLPTLTQALYERFLLIRPTGKTFGLDEFADEGCAYKDNCPPFGTGHGSTLPHWP